MERGERMKIKEIQADNMEEYEALKLVADLKNEHSKLKSENAKLTHQLETACMLLAVNVGNIDKVKDGGAITINKTKANKDANSWLEFIKLY
jgi:hypothetical protein